jgi:hypothetical protein
VDFSEVIEERKRHYEENESYRMIGCDIRDSSLLSAIPKADFAIVIMEGVSMYLSCEDLKKLLCGISSHFGRVMLLTDCYSVMAAKLSKYKNPTKELGVRSFFGIDSPEILEAGGFSFVKEHTMTPKKYIDELCGAERFIFKTLYAGSLSKKLYRLFEYEKI